MGADGNPCVVAKAVFIGGADDRVRCATLLTLTRLPLTSYLPRLASRSSQIISRLALLPKPSPSRALRQQSQSSVRRLALGCLLLIPQADLSRLSQDLDPPSTRSLPIAPPRLAVHVRAHSPACSAPPSTSSVAPLHRSSAVTQPRARPRPLRPARGSPTRSPTRLPRGAAAAGHRRVPLEGRVGAAEAGMRAGANWRRRAHRSLEEASVRSARRGGMIASAGLEVMEGSSTRRCFEERGMQGVRRPSAYRVRCTLGCSTEP